MTKKERQPRSVEDLVAVARRSSMRAYAPYSEFHVGAVLCDAAGTLFPGANIENASYPLGFCAERTALLLWRAESTVPIVRVVVYTEADRLTPPCGLCRDALRRWAPDAEVYLANSSDIGGPFSPTEWSPPLGAPK